MRTIDMIVVHCTATNPGAKVSMDIIDGWHRARGWSGVGYHFGVPEKGPVEIGRPVARIGAHVAGWNARSIGVVYYGGNSSAPYEDTRNDHQKAELEKLIRDLLKKYPSIKRIAGHNEFAAKACPCFDARAEYEHLLKRPGEPAADEILGRRDFGPAVRTWQGKLREFAYPDVAVDGDFGPATEEATHWFQESQGILADGLVGPQAREEMEAALQALAATR